MLVIQSQFISAISFWVLLNDSEFKGSRAVAKKQFILQHHHRLGHSHGRHHNESSRLGSFNFFHNSFYTSLNWSEILILSIFSLVDCVNINDFEVEEEDHLPEFLYPYLLGVWYSLPLLTSRRWMLLRIKSHCEILIRSIFIFIFWIFYYRKRYLWFVTIVLCFLYFADVYICLIRSKVSIFLCLV